MSKFIIYGLVDPRTDEIRYIGKSAKGLKRPESHKQASNLQKDRTAKANWIRSLHAQDLKYTIRALGEFDNAECLSFYEQWAIAYGHACGWQLTNGTEGGEGGDTRSGMQHTPEARVKISVARTGRAAPQHVAEMLRTIWIGRHHSEETKALIGAVHRGKKVSIETREKLRRNQLGKLPTETTRARMREARKTWLVTNGVSQETCRKISEALKGKTKPYMVALNKSRVWTPEMREKVACSRRLSKRPRIRINLFNESES